MSPEIVRILLDAGFELPEDREKFNVLNGAAAELIDLMYRTGRYSRDEAIEELTDGTYWLMNGLYQVEDEYDDDEILDFFDYIADWYEDFIRLLSSDGSSRGEYAHLLAGLAEFDRMVEPFDTYLTLLGDSIPEVYRAEMINKAVKADNKPGFDALLRHWPELIKEVKIYPTFDMEILEELFASNVLLPGTDEAFAAFCDFLERGNEHVDNETFYRLMHDSYLSKVDRESNEILLTKAMWNTNLSPEELRSLISTPEYINIQDHLGYTALHNALKRGLPLWFIDELLGRGADPAVSDEKGNNALHFFAYYTDEETFRRYAEIFPPELMSEKNFRGETPEDTFANKNNIAYM